MAQKILVVDDEAPTREMLRLFLTMRGLAVECAVSGAEAMAAVKNGALAAIILDIELQDASGIDLLPEILRFQPSVPVIIFTGLHVTAELRDQALQAGASGFLSKTQPMSEMLAELQRVMTG